jgi:outer membrane protein assembly factor BamB
LWFCCNSIESDVIVPESNACYALDLVTGNVKGKVDWKNYFVPTRFDPHFKVENHRLYVNNYNDQMTLYCRAVYTGATIWSLKNVYYHGMYKNFIVGTTPDNKYYFIIDKITGKVLHKIVKFPSSQMDFDFIDNYILINGESIYR